MKRSHELNLEQYDTDKIAHHYLEQYDLIFEPFLEQEIRLLELGIYKGGSLLLWRDYFKKGHIVGVDLNLPKQFKPGDRIQIFQGSQADPLFLTQVALNTAPEGFDIIIDDASHIGSLTSIAFWHLFDNHLKPSGLYIIEDWGTGYWEDWVDGKKYRPRTRFLNIGPSQKQSWHNHSYGMVGLVKQLVDEVGAAALTRGRRELKPQRKSKFAHMLITPQIVIIKKKP